jgi:Spy/CpxP family protein refolding chaperone
MAWLSNYRILWTIIIVLIGLNLTSLGALWVTRQRKPLFPMHPRQSGIREHFLKRALELSDKQTEQFDRLEEDHRVFIDRATREVHRLRQELMNEMGAPMTDEKRDDLMDEISKKQAEIELRNFQHFTEISEILNADQRARFKEIMQRAVMPAPDRMRHGAGHGDARRGPGFRKPRAGDEHP